MKFIAPLVSLLFIGAIIFGFASCRHAVCRGSDIDAFLPAFALSLPGIPALAMRLQATIKTIRIRQSPPWGLWPATLQHARHLIFERFCLRRSLTP